MTSEAGRLRVSISVIEVGHGDDVPQTYSYQKASKGMILGKEER